MIKTGQTVLKTVGIIKACTDRQKICNYACCKFNVGNWIMMLPGELEAAHEQKLSVASLDISEDGVAAVCQKPCVQGDLKPLDCSWYPLFPANETATKFLVADHRKCPIPNHELVKTMFEVSASALAWDARHPGSLKQMVEASRNFVGYLPFPYKIEGDQAILMDADELSELMPPHQLPEDYQCKEWPVKLPGYTATNTPDEQ